PEGLLLGAKKISRPAADCIYVGDHVRDIEAGRAAGMHTIAAAFGYLAAHDDPASWRADQIAATPAMLCEQLLAKIQR
ncbi:MAG: HAD hydrolase-like protein, partial [Gammaproteobacteria bacterium]|nr:HAD hydrolase-like protein [Gammaproteobacteria bacterium]